MSSTAAMQAPAPKPSNVSDARNHLDAFNPVAAAVKDDNSGQASSESTAIRRPPSSSITTRNRSVSDSTSRLPEPKFGGDLRRSETISGRMSRKRTADDLDLVDEDQEEESQTAAYPNSAGSLANHICLCQPAPKIPRPRNGTVTMVTFACVCC
jgi:hypothetical protein